MYKIDAIEYSAEFRAAWFAAGKFIQQQATSDLMWLRKDINSPCAEHLSFRIGNKLFFIFVEAAEQEMSRREKLLLDVALAAGAIPCKMKMHQLDGNWVPVHPGWGLTHAESGDEILPLNLLSDELIEMSAWELHDFSIQVVCGYLEKEGKEIQSKQSTIEIDPSIWFLDGQSRSYVVVREVCFPEWNAPIPSNIESIKQNCNPISEIGYFASVSVANADNHDLPPYRGHGMHVRFTGIEEL